MHLMVASFPEVFKYRWRVSETMLEVPYYNFTQAFSMGVVFGIILNATGIGKKLDIGHQFAADMGISDQLYMNRNTNPADYEEAYVESSGATADIIPVVMSDEFVGSYMGKELLDLQMTTNCFNDDPWGGPISDVQAYWQNPYAADDCPTCGGIPLGPSNWTGETL